ncbi:MAG: argininosuccinate lyase [Acidobacteriota bacterium]
MSRDKETLWRKEGGAGVDQMVQDFTVGDDVFWDQRLVPFDCKASIAHVRMLATIDLLTAEEAVSLENCLDEIVALEADGKFKVTADHEDCHTAIELSLTEKLGALGKKVHVGRSRNDQVLTALRLYELAELHRLENLVGRLSSSLEEVCGRNGEIGLPGYTHMQPAMPSSVGLWLGCFRAALEDDLILLDAARRLINQNPLGTAAGFGVPVFELDRQMTAADLGFARVQENSIYAQHSRGKFEGVVLNGASQIMYDLNRLASDLMLFTMREMAFVILPEALCTGSSIMPQKRNPDVLELIRAKYHAVLGEEMTVRNLGANLISGYNRDVQLTKGPLMRGLDATAQSLAMMARIITEMEIDAERCRQAMGEEIYATEKAYRLVREGVPFRDAYRRVAEEARKK